MFQNNNLYFSIIFFFFQKKKLKELKSDQSGEAVKGETNKIISTNDAISKIVVSSCSVNNFFCFSINIVQY